MKFKKRIFWCIIALLLCLTPIDNIGYAVTFSTDKPAYDGYIIKLKEDAKSLRLFSVDDKLEKVAFTEGYYLADNISDAQDMIDAGMVEYIEPNYNLELLEDPGLFVDPDTGLIISSDIDAKSMFTDDTLLSEQWSLDMINFASLYETGYNGSGVKVAIIDSGIFSGHEDFENVDITGYNFLGNCETDGVTDAYYRDQTGHGTFVTGLIASQCNNSKGIAGLADEVDVLMLRCFSGSGDVDYPFDTEYDSGSGSVAVIISALGYAVTQGADVINMSFGGNASSLSNSLADAINNAADSGAILVSSAGNTGGTAYFWPASFNSVVSVGMVNSSGLVVEQSQHNSALDVTAPGYEVISLDNDGISNYTKGSGTSYSASFITSLAAIVKEVDSEIDTYGFLSLLPLIVNDDVSGNGYDTYYGHGIVDSGKLLDVLSAENSIYYELNGGSLEDIYPSTYTIDRNIDVILPTPTREEYDFEGWYKDADFTDTSVASIPAGSVGALTYYAKWSGAVGTIPEVADGQNEQTGSAVPASYDKLVEVIDYSADMSDWFENETGYFVEACSGSGNIEVIDTILKYSPAAADANTAITILISALNGHNKSTGTVTVTIEVGALPASNSIIHENTAEYDIYIGGDLKIALQLNGNSVSSIEIDEALLIENTDYIVVTNDIVDVETVTMKESYMTGLNAGTHTISFTFSAGSTVKADMELSVIDSTPITYYSVTFMNNGIQYTQITDIASGDILTLPEAPTLSDHTFCGWFTEENGAGTEINTGITVVSNIVAYAKWTPTDDGSSQPGDTSGTGDPGDTGAPGDLSGGGAIITPTNPNVDDNTNNNTNDSIYSADDVTEAIKGKTTEANFFSDVDPEDWYFDDVEYLWKADLLPESKDNLFEPMNSMKRNTLVSVLWRFENKPSASIENPFADVDLKDEYYDAVLWGYETGIISGYGNDTFGPDDSITREQMVSILWRYAQHVGVILQGHKVLSEKYSDAKDVSSWAEAAFGWAIDAGIIFGTSDSTLTPQGTATRAEMAAIVTRFIR